MGQESGTRNSGGVVFDEAQVPLYYSRKTADILHKYGPGPRVHFHVGMFEPGDAPNMTVAQRVIRRRICDSQEAVLDHASENRTVPEAEPVVLLGNG